jgi:hypothetical protein
MEIYVRCRIHVVFDNLVCCCHLISSISPRLSITYSRPNVLDTSDSHLVYFKCTFVLLLAMG